MKAVKIIGGILVFLNCEKGLNSEKSLNFVESERIEFDKIMLCMYKIKLECAIFNRFPRCGGVGGRGTEGDVREAEVWHHSNSAT